MENCSVYIMGDQLSDHILSGTTRRVLMVESLRGCRKAHKRRVAFYISAMRHFREALEKKGYAVDYYEWAPDILSALREHVKKERIDKLYVMKPKDRSAVDLVNSLGERLSIGLEVTPNSHFMCPDAEFARWLSRRKLPRIEHFYRMMRKTRDVLMDGKGPAGGQWTYDRENKKEASIDRPFPPVPEVEDDAITRAVINEVNERFSGNFGELTSLGIPVDREGALRWESDFIERRLKEYGPFEYIMRSNSAILCHSMTSPLLNAGLLAPGECVAMAETAYRDGKVPVNSAEGYIKQVMGWREYIAGMYTVTSSDILGYNYFRNKNKLPAFFGDESETRMNCVRHAVEAIRKTGYVNHTARLMVLGNLALLIGVDPRALYEWSMEAFVDACEWAAAPNAICMSQYADGGRIAMKPYVSSASLINRTSDYCHSCYYDPDEKLSEKACPFNYLYWNFMMGAKTYEIKSCRLTIPHRTLERAKPSVRDAYERKARGFIDSIENIRIK